MKCPIDENELVISERQGIEIDYCPKCRGVWLDRGELDKLIERTAAVLPSEAPARRDERPRHDERRAHHDEYRGDDYKRRKKKSLLGELFDF